MYRDDVCATCGESLPPDHLYCREHAAEVDDRLAALGAALDRFVEDGAEVRRLLGELAQETFDYVAEEHDDDPEWPPPLQLEARLEADRMVVEVDEEEPGFVRLALRLGLRDAVAALLAALEGADVPRFAQSCRAAEGAGATH
ncbi:MAG: hypothetical protein KY434_08655 [Actinobacteria bacterium]|nr:hypothetical protein [Actinomycetota bacterium]